MRGAAIRRGAGWLATAALVGAAFFLPGGAAANEGNPPNVACDGYDLWLKIDNVTDAGLVDGDYTMGDPDVESNWDGQTITIDSASEDGQAFDWSATVEVASVVVKGGQAMLAFPGGTEGSIAWEAPPAISFVIWCGPAEEETPTPTPSETRSETPTETPTGTPTPTPTGSVEGETGTPTLTPTPTGSVAGETGTPASTLPPTDMFGNDGTAPDGSWRLFLLGAAAILAMFLLAIPEVVRRR